MPRLKMQITGESVQEVGLRAKLISVAMELGIERFSAVNLEDGRSVLVLMDADEEKVKAFKSLWRERLPRGAEVEETREEPFDGEVPYIYNTILSFEFEHWNRAIPVLIDIRDGVKMVGMKVDIVAEKVDNTKDELGKKIDKVTEELGEKIDETREELGEKVDRTREELGEKIDKVTEGIDLTREDFRAYLGKEMDEIKARLSRLEEAVLGKAR